MGKEAECIFCKESEFPEDYQLVSNEPKCWIFAHNKNPHCDYHCLIVLKPSVFDKIEHFSNLGDAELPEIAQKELGQLLNKACATIKACSEDIESVFVASVAAGERTKHLHFHLIPKQKKEKVKTLHNPERDGGGMFFLARKELIGDAMYDQLESSTGLFIGFDDNKKKIIKTDIKERVESNTKQLRKNFSWKTSS
jgi:diadenosine tetraphosphate (Ap4A) HIT family hydrolase